MTFLVILRSSFISTYQITKIGFYLLDFLSDFVVLFLEDDHVEVRKSAVISCCKLIKTNAGTLDGEIVYSTVVNDVVEKLLVLGITDPGK